MKKKLRNLASAAAAILLAGLMQPAGATHYQGSDLTYINIAPNMYVANLKLYRDCSGVAAPATATLNIKSVSCNNGRNLSMTKVGGSRIGSPYCAAIAQSCTTTGPTNYEEVVFTATVTFSAAEQNCPEWLLSWSECCRPSVANINGQDALYTEAMVRLGTGINNSSPEFSPLNVPIPFVNYNQPISISVNAMEADGDSLVYSLVNPLKAYNDPIPFSTYPASVIFNSDSTKMAATPAGTYSSSYPVFSYDANWNQPMPLTAVQKFMFDPHAGSISFIPSAYDPVSPSAAGKNKYVMVVKIDEYRKVAGAVTKVGSIRRDMMVNVMDCGPNQNPNIGSPVVNGQPVNANDIINLRPGTPMTMQFDAIDGNAADVVSLSSDVASALPGATFSKTTASKPTATINWTPSASHVSGRTYYFRVNVMDNACPVKGFSTFTFGVKVSATGGVTGINDKGLALQKFVAYPNPFTETVSFKLQVNAGADQHLVIYNTLGQQVDRITLKGFAAGEQTITWKNASKMANGQYIAKLISNQKEVQTIQFSKMQ